MPVEDGKHPDILPPGTMRPRLPGETVGASAADTTAAIIFQEMRERDRKAFIAQQLAQGKSHEELVAAYGQDVLRYLTLK